jgi:hypothetical protein
MRRNFHPSQCRYVISVGVEVECGIQEDEDYRKLWEWVRENEEVSERFECGSDGSVAVGGCAWRSLELRYWVEVDQWEWMEKVLKFLWEEVRIRQNSTCGNHVHLRVKEEYLPLLVYPQFILYFQRSYTIFGQRQKNPIKYYRRRRGSYSAFYRGDIEGQVIQQYRGGGSRYRAVNYQSLHEWQRTIEIRVMPYAEDYNEHLAQITFVLRVVENYISTVLRGRRVLECSEVSLSNFLPLQLRRLWCSFRVPQAFEVATMEVNAQLPPIVVEVNNPMLGGELS